MKRFELFFLFFPQFSFFLIRGETRRDFNRDSTQGE